MRIGFFAAFAWPLLALYAFSRGGAWTFVFVPVLLGLAAAELGGLWWKGRAGRFGARPRPPTTTEHSPP
jgi:hypothetical protein